MNIYFSVSKRIRQAGSRQPAAGSRTDRDREIDLHSYTDRQIIAICPSERKEKKIHTSNDRVTRYTPCNLAAAARSKHARTQEANHS